MMAAAVEEEEMVERMRGWARDMDVASRRAEEEGGFSLGRHFVEHSGCVWVIS